MLSGCSSLSGMNSTMTVPVSPSSNNVDNAQLSVNTDWQNKYLTYVPGGAAVCAGGSDGGSVNSLCLVVFVICLVVSLFYL